MTETDRTHLMGLLNKEREELEELIRFHAMRAAVNETKGGDPEIALYERGVQGMFQEIWDRNERIRQAVTSTRGV